ncbi:hypothetical protein K8I28_06145, partial [bacterium]|nr:hypothetical protein [bacterium]
PWWSELESLEHLSYSVAAAGFISMDHVFNAHGSNLAARRAIYERIGGYGEKAKIISGDDVFLLQDVANHGGKVVFINRQEGYVYSQPVDTIGEWVNQRARWSSKGFYYPPFLRILVVGTFAFYAIVIAAISLAFTGSVKPTTAVVFLMSKLISESAIMKLGTIRFDESISLKKYLLTQIVHPFAILYAGVRGQFFSFTWKGQKYSSNNKRK